VRSVGTTNPEADLESRAAKFFVAAHHLRLGKKTCQALRLLDGEKAEWVVHHRRDTALLTAEPVKEQCIDNDAKERFGLAAACGHVEQAGRVGVKSRVEVPLVSGQARSQSRDVCEHEGELEQSPARLLGTVEARIGVRECPVQQQPSPIGNRSAAVWID